MVPGALEWLYARVLTHPILTAAPKGGVAADKVSAAISRWDGLKATGRRGRPIAWSRSPRVQA